MQLTPQTIGRLNFHQRSSILVIVFTLLLTACARPDYTALQAAQQFNVTATQAAYLVQTEIARPSRTPVPSSTPTLLPTHTPAPASATPPQTADNTPQAGTNTGAEVQATALPGLVLYTHSDIPDYVFQIDPARWEKDPSGETSALVDKTNANCRIDSVPGHGLSSPERLLWKDLGRFRWEIMDYGNWAYVYPVSGGGVRDGGSSFLELRGYHQSACRAGQEEILANLMPQREAAGEFAFTPFMSPTPRPALEDFSCPDMPPARLRVGDQVSIITNGLWLRSDPRADESTKVRKFLRYAPFMVRVTGGPVCEKYVYWQVEISTFGEAAETTQGWLAEGDPQEYYLMAVK